MPQKQIVAADSCSPGKITMGTRGQVMGDFGSCSPPRPSDADPCCPSLPLCIPPARPSLGSCAWRKSS